MSTCKSLTPNNSLVHKSHSNGVIPSTSSTLWCFQLVVWRAAWPTYPFKNSVHCSDPLHTVISSLATLLECSTFCRSLCRMDHIAVSLRSSSIYRPINNSHSHLYLLRWKTPRTTQMPTSIADSSLRSPRGRRGRFTTARIRCHWEPQVGLSRSDNGIGCLSDIIQKKIGLYWTWWKISHKKHFNKKAAHSAPVLLS